MQQEIRSEVLKTMPYGFYIVGVTGQDGQANGFTANWVSQASFEPPQVTVAVRKGSHGHDMIRESGVFTLNFLDNTQEELAREFSRHQEPEGDTIAGVHFVPGPGTGAPLLDDAFAHLECRVAASLEAGDHTVFLGEVVAATLVRPADILTDLETPLEYGGLPAGRQANRHRDT